MDTHAEKQIMIQLGPLKLADALAATIGIKEGRYRRLASGEEMIIQAPKNAMRVSFRMEDWKKGELVELLRNTQMQSIPLYSAHEYLSGNYALQTLRESPLSNYYSEFELVMEKTSEYIKKLQDIMIRQDDWTVLLNQDFDDGTSIGDSILPKFESLHVAGVHTNFVATDDDIQAMSGTRVWKIEPTGYKGIAIFGTHWRNYRYSAWVRCNDAFEHGIIWRAEEGNIGGYTGYTSKSAAAYANRGRHYRLVVDTTNNNYVIEYHSAWGSGDVPEIIWTQSEEALGLNTWYHLSVICVGDTHYCFVNGQLIHYFEDTRAKGGMVGVVLDSTASGDYLYVDDILVHEVPYVPLVLDESHTEPSVTPLKTRETPRGTIGYYEHPEVSYKMNRGGSNCVLHLRFDQPYGNKVFDLSGNDNHADIVGGLWSNTGYISFNRPQLSGTTDGTFIRIPHSSELNTDSEGTLIIRMRNRIPYGSGFAQKIISKGNGAWRLSIDYATDLNFCIDEDGPCGGDSIQSPTGGFSQQFETYVVRWKKSSSNMSMYKNGRLMSAPSSSAWTSNGHETTDPILIGNANVDIEYVLLYDKYLEFPDLPDSFGVRLMDVDTHNEHEIFDVRWCDPIATIKEYWSDSDWTNSGSEHLDDLTSGQDSSLLYRRGGLALKDTTDYVYTDLLTHISDSLEKADFTLELVLSHNTISTTQSTAYDIFSICDSTGATQSLGLSLYRGPTGPTYLRATIKTTGGTETHDLFPLITAGSGVVNRVGSIIQVIFKADDLSLTAYWNGKKAGSSTLNNAIDGTDLARVYLGKRNATGTGCENVILYRARIIGTVLTKQEIREIYHEYDKSPIQVFGEHEFKGYPELNNGLTSVRPTGNYADNEIGERPLFEIYDNGSYSVPSGDSGGNTEPMELRHSIDDESNTYLVRSFGVNPIVRSVSQDHVEIEFRNQFQRRDQYLAAQGIYTRQRMELALGMFSVDNEIQVNTRSTNWDLYLVHNDMQVLWQEGSYVKYEEIVGNSIWQTFISCNGPGAAAKTLNTAPSKPYFASYTILANWSNHDYALGIMLSSMDDHMQVEIAAGDAVLKDDVYFKNIQGSKLRVVMGIIPVTKESIYKTENDWTLYKFTVQTSQNEFIDDNNVLASGDNDNATAIKSISYEPGIYRLFFNFVFTKTAGFLMSVYDSSGYYRALRRQRVELLYVKPEQMWFDLDLVVNATTAESLNTKLHLHPGFNGPTQVAEFDGAVILPLWNGADFILDQLYLARQLKLVRRHS